MTATETTPNAALASRGLPRLVGLADGAERILRTLRVLVVGCGSVGARAAMDLARAGVRRLGLVDPKRFGPNADTQALRSAQDVGRPKASTVAAWARCVAPETEIVARDRAVQDLPWYWMDDYDIVLASTDNLSAELAIGERAMWLGKPLVLASLHGQTLTTQLRVFANRDGDGPCPACSYSGAEWAMLQREARFSCAPDGAAETPAAIMPTASVAPLCALTASMASLTVLRLALDLGADPRDTLLEYNTYRHQTVTSPLTRNAECTCDHHRVGRAAVAGELAGATLRDCAAAAGVAPGAVEGTLFRVDDAIFCWTATCAYCDQSETVNRFIGRDRAAWPACRRCGRAALVPHPFHSFESFALRSAGLLEHIDKPLGQLGARGEGVLVSHDGGSVLVRSAGSTEP